MFIHLHKLETLEQPASSRYRNLPQIFLQSVGSFLKQRSNLAQTHATKEPKGKSVIGESSQNAKGSQYFKC